MPSLVLFQRLILVCFVAAYPAFSTNVTEIQGSAFISPLKGKTVENVTGVVTAKGPDGFWIIGSKSDDIRVSNGLNIFTTSSTIQSQVSVGDLISVNAIVSEFRSSSRPDDLSVTELEDPTNIVIISSGNEVTPVVLGVDRSPPTENLSVLDVGKDGFLSVPNNQSQVDTVDPTLNPEEYGLDFWESLEGQLVTIRSPTVTDFENSFGEFFVYGDWPVTGKNTRGGLTMMFGENGIPDANPEAIIIGEPLDGTDNPSVAVGQVLGDITGVIVYQFGYFYVLPTTAPVIVSSPDFTTPKTSITSSDDSCTITLGDYNVENLAPTSDHLTKIAQHIVESLNSPDILFLQEIQDNSGPTDDGTVSANVTLQTLVDAISEAGGSNYSFIDIDPVDGMDGGQPGGNIRQAYLYRSDKLKLAGNAPPGGSLDAVMVTVNEDGTPSLNLNPGRIEPTSGAWNSSRKPLVALWEAASVDSDRQAFFTINLHLTSKGGSTTVHGNARPPVNLGVDQRTSQVGIVSTFVKTILDVDSAANVIVAGDCNEFLMTRSVFASVSGILQDVDEVADIPPTERYTYVFAQNNEQLDHIFVSSAIAGREVEVEHVHVNNWAPSIEERASDHDPSVAKLRIC